jgi:hypothetical protein
VLVHPEGDRLSVVSFSKNLGECFQGLRNALLYQDFEALALGRQMIDLARSQSMNTHPRSPTRNWR